MNMTGQNIVTGYDHYRNSDYLEFLSPMQSPKDVSIFNNFGYVMIGSDRQPLNHNLLSLLGVKYILTTPAGLWMAAFEQSRNDAAFPIYADVTQTQVIESSGMDALEFLIATGGGPGPDSEVSFTATNARGEVIAQKMVSGDSITDNSWYVLELNKRTTGEIRVEIAAPNATAERPLFVWGTREETPEFTRRLESGRPEPGAMVFRALLNPGDWVTEVYSGSDGIVYKVKDPLPPAWGVGESVTVSAWDEAVLRILIADSFDPRSEVVLAGREAPPSSNDRADFKVKIGQLETDRLTAQTNFPRDGWLVVSRRYDDGWKAKLDGDRVTVERADHSLMAVRVPAGEHSVSLSFEPSEYVWGRRISAVSLLTVVAAGVGYALWLRHRRSAPRLVGEPI